MIGLEAFQQQNPRLQKEIKDLSGKLDKQFMQHFFSLMQEDVNEAIEDVGEKTYQSMLSQTQIQNGKGKGLFQKDLENYLWRLQLQVQNV